MKPAQETVRNLEQQETGEIRRLICSGCGLRSFVSLAQLYRHETACAQARARRVEDSKSL